MHVQEHELNLATNDDVNKASQQHATSNRNPQFLVYHDAGWGETTHTLVPWRQGFNLASNKKQIHDAMHKEVRNLQLMLYFVKILT